MTYNVDSRIKLKKKKMSLTPPLITPTNPNLTPLYHHLLAFESPFSCFWKSFLIYHNFLSLPFSLLSCNCENVKDMELLKMIHRNKIIKNHLLISLSLSCKQCCVFFFLLLLFNCSFATNKESVELFSLEKPTLAQIEGSIRKKTLFIFFFFFFNPNLIILGFF